jgi:hypothetical protein
LQVVWESIVAGVSRVFRNRPKNRIATKIPISGARADVLSTLGNILENEFSRAFASEFEGNIEPADAEIERKRAD